MARMNARMLRALMIGASALALAGCENGFDFDLRGSTGAFGTADAVRGEAPSRPEPDPRGVISYPAYQVAVAQPGDTVSTLAGRVGLPADEVARFNGLTPDMALREGEVVALPRRVSEPAGGFAGGGSGTDVASIAGAAIDRASGGGPGVATPPGTLDAPRGSSEPTRHQVVRGETAYTIARLYGVSVRALADWNGLGPDLAVREGSYLMIPPAAPASSGVETTTLPGEGTATPLPPSAETPLPEEDETPEAETETPPSPDLGSERTEAPAQGTLAMPVRGSIIRAYERGKNEGIDISATAGADVTAAAAGTVAAVTQSTENVSIVIIRHDGAAFGSSEPILTVYANLEGITVARGASVSRGQAIGKVRAGNPAFIRFEVRRGFETLDPTEYLR